MSERQRISVVRNSSWAGDEVTICMLIAFCLGNAVLSAIYRLLT